MKKLLIGTLVIAVFSIGSMSAAPGFIGLGVMAGEPTGLSAKLWIGNRIALDAGLAYSFLWHGTGVNAHADLLLHTRSLVPGILGFLPLYAGVGARVRFANGVSNPMLVGARIPFGVEYVFPIIPLGLFAEVAPIIDFVPSTSFEGNSAVGIRYYFGSPL